MNKKIKFTQKNNIITKNEKLITSGIQVTECYTYIQSESAEEACELSYFQ